MSLFITVVLPMVISALVAGEIENHLMERKVANGVRKQKNLYYALWKMTEDETEWKREGHHFFYMETPPYRVNAFEDRGCIRLQFIENQKVSLDVGLNEHNHLAVFRNNIEDWFDIAMFVQLDEKLYRYWADKVKTRFAAEKELRGSNSEMNRNRLQKEWTKLKKEEKEAFRNMMNMLTQVPSMHLQKESDVLWSDRFFTFTYQCTEETFRCELSLSSGTTLFESEARFQEESTSSRFTKETYFTVEQKEQCMKVAESLLNLFVRKEHRSAESFRQAQEIPDVFQETVQKINAIGKETEWLTDTEKHLLHQTYPKDLQDVMALYRNLDEEGKRKAFEMLERSQKEWGRRLDGLEQSIQQRKLRKLEEKVRVIEMRLD